MSRRHLNKALVSLGVPIICGEGTQVTTSRENDGIQSVFIPVRYTIACDWIGTRYFAVDYDGGSDTAVGFSDVSMADAGTKAVKTFEEVLTRIPRNGFGQKVVIAVKARASGATYLKKDAVTPDSCILAGFTGYSYMLVRGTSTNATASSVAFANDTNEKIYSGAIQTSGTNSTGYKFTGTPTVNTFDVELSGGGAPGLAAEPGLIGKRIRFDSATTTVALRNVASMIWKNTTSNIIVSSNLPATPALTDVFYIEEPGTTFDSLNISSSTQNTQNIAPTFGAQGIFIVGVRTSNASVGTGGFLSGFTKASMSFTEAQATSTVSAAYNITDFTSFVATNTFIDESTNTITTGTGFKGIGIMNCTRGIDIIIAHSALTGVGGRVQCTSLTTWALGNGCYFGGGILLNGCTGGSVGTTALFTALIGRGTSTTTQRLRVTNPVGSTPAGIIVAMSSTHIYGVEITGMSSSRCISLRGTGQNLTINDVIGASASTGNCLDFVDAIGCTISIAQLAAVTVTNATGKDIVCANDIFYLHADYQRCDLADNTFNTIQGSGGVNTGTTVLVANDGNSVIEQYKVVRASGDGIVRKAQSISVAQNSAVGVSQGEASTSGNVMIVNGGGTWLQFDSAPSAGNTAYLSTATVGNAQTTMPTGIYKLKLGTVLKVIGTLGYIDFNPVKLTLDELNNLTVTAPAADDILTFNGTSWQNTTVDNYFNKYLPHGEIYYEPALASFTTIALPTLNTAVLVNPVTTLNPNSENFDTPSAGRLRYIGTPLLCFHCAFGVSLTNDTPASTNFFVYLYKNGVKINGSAIANTTTTTTTAILSATIHSFVQMSTNDYIELYILNNSNTNSVRIKTLNLFAMGMPC